MQDNNLAEFADKMRNLAPVEIKSLSRPMTPAGITVAAVPEGMTLMSLKPLLDEYLTAPERKAGTALAQDEASFAGLVNREKCDNSVIFADTRSASLKLLAILDFHHAAAPADSGAPEFCRYRVRYDFPLSNEWQAWNKHNGIKMSQGEFAEFIENRLLDLIEPPNPARDDPAVDAILELQRKLGGTFAPPSMMLQLSRGMAVNVECKIVNIVNLSTGAAQVQFEETHADGQGAPLTVPSLFLIGIPVFRDGVSYRLAVRLRYRKEGGQLKWFYEIYRADKALEDAFGESCGVAALATGLPLFRGVPDVP